MHRRPRHDSRLPVLWAWAIRRRGGWTTRDAALAAGYSDRRSRAIIHALVEAGYLEQVSEGSGGEPSEYIVAAAARKRSVPIIVVAAGQIVGVRPTDDDGGNAILRDRLAASGLSATAFAAAIGTRPRTLQDLIDGDVSISADDPLIARARKLS